MRRKNQVIAGEIPDPLIIITVQVVIGVPRAPLIIITMLVVIGVLLLLLHGVTIVAVAMQILLLLVIITLGVPSALAQIPIKIAIHGETATQIPAQIITDDMTAANEEIIEEAIKIGETVTITATEMTLADPVAIMVTISFINL